MADTLWVRISKRKSYDTLHALRPDDTSATVCGLEVGEDDFTVDSITIKDDVCNNCLRLIGKKADVEIE